MSVEFKDESWYLLLGGSVYEYPKEQWSIEALKMEVTAIVKGENLFTHTSGRTGIFSMMRVPEGMPVQIVPGAEMRRIVREQHMAAMMQQQPPQAGRRSQ
jgi:hypothetical protein